MATNDDWDLDTTLDAMKCLVTVPPTRVDYTCNPRLYQSSAMAKVPLKKGSGKDKNFYILLDPNQDGSVKEGIYREYRSIAAQLPNNTIDGTRYITRGWGTFDQARQHWKDLCKEHHKCDTWALEAAKRDADLARPRLLMVELSNLYPGIMSSVPVSLNGTMRLPNPNIASSSTGPSGSGEVSASPNLLRSPPSTPSRSGRATSPRDDPPAYDGSTGTTNGGWILYVASDIGICPYDSLRRAYRNLKRQLRNGQAALLLALTEEAAEEWYGANAESE